MPKEEVNPYLDSILRNGQKPESLHTSHAIASRILQEELDMEKFITTQMDYVPPTSPSIFTAAVQDIYAKAVRGWMKAPSPVSFFFTNREKLLEDISPGDWRSTFEEMVEIEGDSNPYAVDSLTSTGIRNMRNLMLLAAKYSPPDLFGRPESRYPAMTTLLTSAIQKAECLQVPVASFYESDDKYGDLIRSTFPREGYIDAWMKVSDRQNDLKFLRSRIKLELQVDALLSQGQTLTDQELTSKYSAEIASQMMDDVYIAKNTQWLNAYHKALNLYSVSQINRFWPPNSQA